MKTVQRGALYRLVTLENDSPQSATEYVSRDGSQAVVFAFLLSSLEYYPYPVLKLEGLDENGVYKLTAFEGKAADGVPVTASGAYWIHDGFEPALYGNFQAAGFTLERLESNRL